MHLLLPPLLLLSSLSLTLASPLSSHPLENKSPPSRQIEQGSNNTTNCPTDPVEEMQKIAFDYTIEKFETARKAALAGSGMQCFIWKSDGCTKSPDEPFGCDFSPSCRRHDFALYNFRDRHVYTAEMKKRIERRLRDDMMAVCEEKGWFRRRACKGAARWYAWVVKKWPGNKPTDDDGWPGWVG